MHEYPDVEQKVQVNISKIETFAERLIRKQILKQYVEPDHPVLRTEEMLVQKSTEEINEEVNTLVKTSGYHVRLIRMAVFLKVKKAARVMIRLHEIDDDTADTALFCLEHEALQRITGRGITESLPGCWEQSLQRPIFFKAENTRISKARIRL